MAMWRTIALYAAALALGAFLLQWLQYTYLTRTMAPEFYVVLIALAFTRVQLKAHGAISRASSPFHWATVHAPGVPIGRAEPPAH